MLYGHGILIGGDGGPLARRLRELQERKREAKHSAIYLFTAFWRAGAVAQVIPREQASAVLAG